jgi:2-polyprenyl-3-methyl-5-hydroxy-6-metoxy-1,4-benzoquinol methylase
LPTNIWNEKGIALDLNFNNRWYLGAENLFSSLASSSMTVVELGCGLGGFASIITGSNLDRLRYIGLDGNVPNITYVKTNLGQDVILADFESRLPLPSAGVDVVVTLEVIEHIANAEGYLGEISRILKPNGHLILSTPNVGFFGTRLDYLFKAEVLQEGIHLRFFNKSKLRAITASAGLKYVKQRSCMPWLGYNTIKRILKLGPPRFGNTPALFETILSTNFVWLLRKEV